MAPEIPNFSHMELTSMIKQAIDESLLAETASRVERHEHILMGNGKEGLVVRFSIFEERLTKDIADVSAQLSELHVQLVPLMEWKNTMVVRMATIVAGASAISAVIGGAIGMLVVYYDKVAPLLHAAAPLVNQ